MRTKPPQTGGQESGDALRALFGSEVVGMVVRSHGTSPWSCPSVLRLATGTLADGIKDSICYLPGRATR
ncbi:MAG TPA: hypothetical protein VH682_10445 [Gemmataceae bacterium]|jgi:hypothetical protein